MVAWHYPISYNEMIPISLHLRVLSLAARKCELTLDFISNRFIAVHRGHHESRNELTIAIT